MIARAATGPIPGRPSSSASVAVFRLTSGPPEGTVGAALVIALPLGGSTDGARGAVAIALDDSALALVLALASVLAGAGPTLTSGRIASMVRTGTPTRARSSTVV